MQKTFWPGALAGALLLAGCAPSAVAPVRESGCGARREASMAVRGDRDVILLPARLEGRAVLMKLDTGAGVSTISPALAAELGLVADPSRERLLRGVGGDVRTATVLAESFAIADTPPEPARFSLAVGTLLPGLVPPVAGLLGTDLIGSRDLDLDVPGRRASLYSVPACPGFQPWPQAAEIAMTRTESGPWLVVLEIGERAVRALVDTGVPITFMTGRLAEALGVTEEMLATDAVSTGFGISRSAIDMRHHRFDEIRLGRAAWRDVDVGVADVALPGVDMLLGADLLGRQQIWISPSRDRLWLQVPPTGGV